MQLIDLSFFILSQEDERIFTERHAQDRLAFGWLPEGWQVTHFVLRERGFTPRPVGDIRFFARPGWKKLPLNLCLTVRRLRPDVVILHGFGFPLQTWLLMAIKKKRTRVIVRHHGALPRTNPFKRYVQRLAYHRADAYTFASKLQAEPFIKKGIVHANRVHEIMEGSTQFTPGDKTAARKQLGLGDERVLLWVGRLDSNKDPLTVLKARCAEKTSWILYMIYTDAPLLQEVRNFILNNHLSNSVKTIGSVPHNELETWYRAADAFVSASHRESSGYAMCEAMACGCFPVASRIASFVKMTANGQVGMLFEPGNVSQLAGCLAEIEKFDTTTEKQRIRDQFERELSFRAICARLTALCDLLSKQAQY